MRPHSGAASERLASPSHTSRLGERPPSHEKGSGSPGRRGAVPSSAGGGQSGSTAGFSHTLLARRVVRAAVAVAGAGAEKFPPQRVMQKKLSLSSRKLRAVLEYLHFNDYVEQRPLHGGRGTYVVVSIGSLGKLLAALEEALEEGGAAPQPGGRAGISSPRSRGRDPGDHLRSTHAVAASLEGASHALTLLETAVEVVGASSLKMPSVRKVRNSMSSFGGEAAMQYLKKRGYLKIVPSIGTFVEESIGTLGDLLELVQSDVKSDQRAPQPLGGVQSTRPPSKELPAGVNHVKGTTIESMLGEGTVMRDVCASVMRAAVKAHGKSADSIPKRKELTHLVQQWGRRNGFEISLATAEVVVLPRMLEYLEDLGYIEALKLKRPRFVTSEVKNVGRLSALLEEAVVHQRAERLGQPKRTQGQDSPIVADGAVALGSHGREIGRLLETAPDVLHSACAWMAEGSARLLGAKSAALPKRRDLTHILQKWGRKNSHEMSLNAADEVVLPRVLEFLEKQGFIEPLVLKRPRFVSQSVQNLKNLTQILKLRLAQVKSGCEPAASQGDRQKAFPFQRAQALLDAACGSATPRLDIGPIAADAPALNQDSGMLSPPAVAVSSCKPWEPKGEEETKQAAALLEHASTRSASGMSYSSRLLKKGLMSIIGALRSFPDGMTREQLVEVVSNDSHLFDHLVQAIMSSKKSVGGLTLRKRTLDFDKATGAGENILFYFEQPGGAGRDARLEPRTSKFDLREIFAPLESEGTLRAQGCSKCRYSKQGCVRCQNPNFRGRTNPAAPARADTRGSGCSKCRYSKSGCIRCDVQRRGPARFSIPEQPPQPSKRKAATPTQVLREGEGKGPGGKRPRATVSLGALAGPNFQIRSILGASPLRSGIFEPSSDEGSPRVAPLGAVGMDVFVGGLNSIKPVPGRVTHVSEKKLLIEIALD